MENPNMPHPSVPFVTDPIAGIGALVLGSVVNLFALIDPKLINEWVILLNTGLITVGMTLVALYTRFAKARREVLAEDEAAHRESLNAKLQQSEKERAELRERLEEAESNVSALLKITPRHEDKSQ